MESAVYDIPARIVEQKPAGLSLLSEPRGELQRRAREAA
jgi:hypothetical protein